MITFRKIRKADYAELAYIVIQALGAENISTEPKSIPHFGHEYLLSCLLNQTYNRVAVVDGKPVGIIIGEDHRIKKWNWKYAIQKIPHSIQLWKDPAFRNGNTVWDEYVQEREDLEEELEESKEAAIPLFMVNERYRRKGIGQKLYDQLMDEFKKKGITSFYTYCNWEEGNCFFEKQGLRLLAESETKMPFKEVPMTTIRIYGNHE